jgi:hypothetical protein
MLEIAHILFASATSVRFKYSSVQSAREATFPNTAARLLLDQLGNMPRDIATTKEKRQFHV